MHNHYAVLICFRAWTHLERQFDGVFREFSSRGVVVHSFKTPNTTELEHDYLWRHYLALPEKGSLAF
jgi:polyphosphate kinase 2 (PPK2 family)